MINKQVDMADICCFRNRIAAFHSSEVCLFGHSGDFADLVIKGDILMWDRRLSDCQCLQKKDRHPILQGWSCFRAPDERVTRYGYALLARGKDRRGGQREQQGEEQGGQQQPAPRLAARTGAGIHGKSSKSSISEIVTRFSLNISQQPSLSLFRRQFLVCTSSATEARQNLVDDE